MTDKDINKEESKTFAEHVKKQMATLKDHDHKLFQQLIDGLVTIGWNEDGGSPTFRLLSKDDACIKVFRSEEAPAVIKICFSAEPEDKVESKVVEFTEDAIKKYLDGCISFWRKSKKAEALIYIDSYQSVRASLFGELKEPEREDEEVA